MESREEFHCKIAEIQQNIVAGKTETNNFGKFKYRNVENILSSLKPLLGELVVNLSDDIELVGEKYFVKATVTISDKYGNFIDSKASAEIGEHKGMSSEQSTGTASSYARKYALCGLLGLDDNKDVDSMDNSKVEKPKQDVDKLERFRTSLVSAIAKDGKIAQHNIDSLNQLSQSIFNKVPEWWTLEVLNKTLEVLNKKINE